ncbi:hypothetical protein FF38_04109 [Lucilia cuprina]|uniref:Uncharacterized protein n=1 Tax=Lucilia cuprina TaxID=7375 RepID=A0A0L0BRS1_LUCCU|nr:hypothetical protein CVS40_7404 [Lucilia cuprina]KNC22742.1 hypothetical protein FF38_04109 [Lucilia cuprina]
MKLHLTFLVLLLVVMIELHQSEAKKDILDNDYIDNLTKHSKKDDNVIVGNNRKNLIQVNGRTISSGNILKTNIWLGGYVMAQLLLLLLKRCM